MSHAMPEVLVCSAVVSDEDQKPYVRFNVQLIFQSHSADVRNRMVRRYGPSDAEVQEALGRYMRGALERFAYQSKMFEEV